GQRQRQQRRSETPSPQQLREWLFQRGASGGSVIRTGDRAGQTCGKEDTQHCRFSRLDDAWRAEFGDKVERPHWALLLRSGVAIFDLDYDAILFAMYALSASAEGVCYRCVPPNPGIDAASLGASESVLPGTMPAEALHTFTLDSGASRCFFRDSTTLTPLPAPLPVRRADPSGGPVVARSSTVLLRLAVPSGSLSGLHLPSFSTNLVSTAALQDVMVTTITPGGQRVWICMCTRTGRHLATFTGRPRPFCGTTALVTPSCHDFMECTPVSLSLVFPGLCLPSRPRLPHPAFPASRGGSASLQTPPRFHMDVWGPARVSGQGRERYILLVVDDYTRYTMVFPLRSKGQVVDDLIPWIRAVRLQLCERFHVDLSVLRLHSDRGGEFSSDLLQDFCHGEGILQSFRILDSPQQNGIAERRISLVMETSPTLRWTGKVGDASMFWAWVSCAFVRDTFADKLSARAILCVFLGISPDAPGCQFYHPTSRHVFPSQDVTFDESRGGEEPEGAEPAGVEPGGAEPEGVEPGGAASEGAESGGAEPQGAASTRGPIGALPRLSPQQEREWPVRRARLWSGVTGAGAARAGGAGVPARAGGTGGTTTTVPGGARARGTGAAGTGGVRGAGAGDPTELGGAGAGGTGPGVAGAGGAGAEGTGAGGAGAGGTGAVDPGGSVRPRLYFVPLLQNVLGVPSSTSLTPPFLCRPPD
ncbi:unnamed protein product, partial [Closterium sp. NIES-53]